VSSNSVRSFEPGTAGWLFADLLLVLSIVTLGAATVPDDVPMAELQAVPVGVVQPAPPSRSPFPGPSPRATPAPTSTPTPLRAKGIDRTPTKLRFAVTTGRLVARDARELRRVRRVLAAGTARLRGRRAALVLTFGCDPDSRIGSTMSATVNSQLRAVDADLFGDTVTRSFMDDSCSGTVRMEIYPFAR